MRRNIRFLKDLKMSGVVNEDFQLIDHMEHTGSEGYLTLPVRATKNGYDKRSSVLNTTQLFNLGRIVEKKMTELGNSLMHGDISIKPYNMKEENLVSIVSLRISAPMKMVLIR